MTVARGDLVWSRCGRSWKWKIPGFGAHTLEDESQTHAHDDLARRWMGRSPVLFGGRRTLRTCCPAARTSLEGLDHGLHRSSPQAPYPPILHRDPSPPLHQG